MGGINGREVLQKPSEVVEETEVMVSARGQAFEQCEVSRALLVVLRKAFEEDDEPLVVERGTGGADHVVVIAIDVRLEQAKSLWC